MRRFLRQFLTFILIVALLGTFPVSVAYGEDTVSDVEICTQLGILTGEGNGITAEYLNKKTMKFQAAIFTLRLRGNVVVNEAISYPEDDNFKDAELLTWAGGRSMLAFLKAHGEFGWGGDPAGNFGPLTVVVPQQLYKVLMEILGYTYGNTEDCDFTWGSVLEFARSLGLYRISELGELTNWDVAVAIVEALRTPVKGMEMTLAEKLVEDGAIQKDLAVELGLVEPDPYIVSAVDIELGTVYVGDEVELPQTAEVLYSDGITGSAYVVWESGMDTTIEGEALVRGIVQDTEIPVFAKALVVIPPLAVMAVVSENPKEIDIRFNRPLEAGRAEDIRNYKVTAYGEECDLVDVMLSADKQAVTLLLREALDFETVYQVLIRSEVGFEQDVVLPGLFDDDVTAPFIKNVAAFGDRLVKVVFSEPLMNSIAIAGFSIDGALCSGKVQQDGNSVLLMLEDSLGQGTHVLSVEDLMFDYSGYELEAVEIPFSVEREEVAPEVEVVSLSQTQLVVRFNEPVEKIQKENVFTRPLAFILSITPGPDMQTYTLEFKASSPLSEKGATVTFMGVTDKWGNSSSKKLYVQPVVDQVPPEYDGYEVRDQNTIILEFSEDVAIDSGRYSVTDEKGMTSVLQIVGWHRNGAGVEYRNKIVLQKKDGSSFDAGSYTLSMFGVRDLSPRGNELGEHTITVMVPDQIKPQVHSIKSKGQRIIVEFSEKVDENTWMEPSCYGIINHMMVPVGLPMGTVIDSAMDGKTVSISFPAGFDMSTISVLNISGIKDLSGNVIDPVGIWTSQFAAITDVPSITSVHVVSKNEIMMEVRSEIDKNTLNRADFIVKAGSDVLTVSYADYDAESGSIRLVIAEDLNTDGTYGGKAVTVETVKQPSTSDVFGERLMALAAKKAVDKYAPKPVNFKVVNNGLNTDIVIYFSENIKTTNGSGKPLASTGELAQFIVLADKKLREVISSRYDASTASDPARITLTISGTFKEGQVEVRFFPSLDNRLSDNAPVPNYLNIFELP